MTAAPKVQPNELARVSCPHCNTFIARFFQKQKPPTVPDEASMDDRLRIMSEMQLDYLQKNKKSKTSIETPDFRVIFNSTHTNDLATTNLAERDYRSRCETRIFIASSPVAAVYRLLTRLRAVQVACIINAIEPTVIRDWLSSLSEITLGSLLSPTLRVREIPQLGLAVGVVNPRDISTFHVKNKGIAALLGMSSWDNQVDHAQASYGYYSESKEQEPITYSDNGYRGDTIADIPKFDFDVLLNKGYGGRIAEVWAGPDRKEVRVDLQYNNQSLSESNIGKILSGASVPEEFWKVDGSRIVLKRLANYSEASL